MREFTVGTRMYNAAEAFNDSEFVKSLSSTKLRTIEDQLEFPISLSVDLDVKNIEHFQNDLKVKWDLSTLLELKAHTMRVYEEALTLIDGLIDKAENQ